MRLRPVFYFVNLGRDLRVRRHHNQKVNCWKTNIVVYDNIVNLDIVVVLDCYTHCICGKSSHYQQSSEPNFKPLPIIQGLSTDESFQHSLFRISWERDEIEI